jgi:hypothetical protein
MTRARDDDGRLICELCERPIGGVTGLDECQNLIAHMAEHHDMTIPDVVAAAELRAEWEAR